MQAPRPISAALAAAGAWLLEPAEPAPPHALTAPAALRPVVAVFGLARGCGTTVVARALAAELARRDSLGAAAVHCDSNPTGVPLATAPASRLAAALAEAIGAETRAIGRLCLIGGRSRGGADAALDDPGPGGGSPGAALGDPGAALNDPGAALVVDSTRHIAPLVLDAGAATLGGAAAALADELIVVASPSVEPALAGVAADCLARVDREPIVVLNRAGSPPDAGRWKGRIAYALPESRMGAQLALGGREPRGALGRAIAGLADRCGGRL
jgi:hypothetical protein